jgi:hypothetical protein
MESLKLYLNGLCEHSFEVYDDLVDEDRDKRFVAKFV